MMRLRLHVTAAPIHTLGPYSRFGIWVQGCTRACPGCVTPEAQPLEGGYEMDVDALAHLILQEPAIEGLTISGGEPFLQADALCALIERVRKFSSLGVILYTGFSYEEIKEKPLTQLCDAIIDGPFIAEMNDGGSMRGSANQRLILLTSRYEGLISFGTVPRKMEWIQPFEGGLAQVGVPSEEDITTIRTLQSIITEEAKGS